MMHSRGFFLVSELLCLGFSIVLLASAAQSLNACFSVHTKALRLQEAWQAAQLAAVGLELDAKYRAAIEHREENGYQIMEVSIYAGQADEPICTFLQNES